MAFGNSRSEQQAKAKKAVKSSGQVKTVKKEAEKRVKRNYYSTGNRVVDRMSQQTYFNSKPENPKYKALNEQLKDSRLYLRNGRRMNAIADYDKEQGRWNYTGVKKDAYKVNFVRDGSGSHTTKSGKKLKGTRLLSDNMMKEYRRNDKVSTGNLLDNSPIHKVDPTGKPSVSPIKEGFKKASESKNPLKAVGHVAGGFVGAGMKGINEISDALNTLNYGAHGLASGTIEGFNNNGKLDKGELKSALSKGLKKGKKGIMSGLDSSGKYDDARYGWYDTFKALSDDKIERNERRGKLYSEKELKAIDAKLAGAGLVADIGGAILTANAGGLAKAGAKLTSKGSKIAGGAATGLSKVAKIADLGIDIPVADLVRGTNKTFEGAKEAVKVKNVSDVVNKNLKNINKGAKSQAIQEHLVNSTVNKVNKMRGIREVNNGVKIGGFEVVGPKTVQNIADSKLNVPGKALNSLIDQIQAKRRKAGLNPNTIDNLAGTAISKANTKGKLIDIKDLTKEKIQNNIPDMSNLQLMRRNNGEKIIAGKPLSYWAKIEGDIANEVFEKGNISDVLKAEQKTYGGKTLDYYKDMQKQIEQELNYNKSISKGIKTEKSMDNKLSQAIALDDERELRKLNKAKNSFEEMISSRNNNLPKVNQVQSIIQDKPVLKELTQKIRPLKQGDDYLRFTDESSDAFYDYVMKNNPKLYSKLTGESDVIEETINATAKLSNPTKAPTLNDFLSKTKKVDLKKPVEKTKIGKQMPYNNRFSAYSNIEKMFKDPGFKTDKKGILERQAKIEQIAKPLSNKTLSKKDRAEVVNQLNDMFFDGYEVISYNASENNLKQFTDALQRGMDNMYNNVPELLNVALNDFKKYSSSLVDPNYSAKTDFRANKFKTTKTKLNKRKAELNVKIKSGKATVADREELRKIQNTINEFDGWWDKYGRMNPEEWDNFANGKSKELKGYYDALEEHADIAKYNKLGYDDFVTANKGSKEYKKQMQEFSEYMLEEGNENLRDAKRNFEARQNKDGSMSYSPLAEKELAMSDVGEVSFDLNTQINSMRKRYNFEKPQSPKLKVGKGQKLGELPPVQHNLRNLRKVIEKEIDIMYKEPNAYKTMNDAFKQIKMDYVTSLRKMGVDDNKYFHKVVALQNELKANFEKINLQRHSNKEIEMNLQLLARKIEDTFNEIEQSFDLNDGAKNDIYDKIYNKVNQTKTDTPYVSPYPVNEWGEIIEPPSKALNANLSAPNNKVDELINPSIEKPNNGLQGVENTSKINNKNPLLNMYDEITKDYKAGVTGLNPGWHMMNGIQNKLNNGYGIGSLQFDKKLRNQAKDLVTYLEGEKEFLGKKYGRKTPTEGMLNQVVGKNADGSSIKLKDVADVMEMEGLIDSKFLDDVRNNGGNFINDYIRPSGDKSIFGGLGLMQNVRTESYDKATQVLGQLKKGNNLSTGIDMANKYLFDYDAVSDVEKNVLKRIMPFYTYYRKNLPLQLERFANSPRAMSQYIDAKNQFEKGIDNEDKQRRNEWNNDKLQVPGFYKVDQKGNPYNLMFNPSTPWDALMQLPTPNGEGVNNLPSFNPILQSLYEYYGKGEDYFGNKFGEKGNNKNVLQHLLEQVVEPSTGTFGKLNKHEREKDKMSKENEALDLLKILTGVNAKYYKSYQDWGFEDNDDYTPEFKKKVLKNRYN